MGGTAGLKGYRRHLEKFHFPLCPLGLSVGCAQHVVPGHGLAVALGGGLMACFGHGGFWQIDFEILA